MPGPALRQRAISFSARTNRCTILGSSSLCFFFSSRRRHTRSLCDWSSDVALPISLLIAENLDVESERYGSSVVAGEMAKSVLFVPLVAGGKAAGVISLQNVDREHAFDEADQQLLTTVAGSVSVALENARLVQETRQRVAELGTVNSVGRAPPSQP